MLVVAGPPGSGKTMHFPVASFGEDGFNVDLRAAAANNGSFIGIPRAVRRSVQRECEQFVEGHIATCTSFAVETTLRTPIAISQAGRARRAGFETTMIFVCAGSADECVGRVRLRGLAGGHSAPEGELRSIYASSLANLGAAVRAFDLVEIYDNGVRGAAPRVVARAKSGSVTMLTDAPRDWLSAALTSVR
jgi:predicted ABC-type ATPase